jgi:hypothetical protein
LIDCLKQGFILPAYRKHALLFSHNTYTLLSLLSILAKVLEATISVGGCLANAFIRDHVDTFVGDYVKIHLAQSIIKFSIIEGEF